MKKLFLLSAICILAAIPNVAQDTIHVPADYSTIQAGINAASNGDLVLVENGTYIENINYLGKAITVASWFLVDGDTNHINNTIINGSQPSHPDTGSVVMFNSGEDTTSILIGFTITEGTGSLVMGPGVLVRNGGGILCHNSGARIMHNIINNNSVTSNTFITAGGGIFGGPRTDNSWTIIENNIIRNNSVTNISTISGSGALGGGICLFHNARVLNNIVEYNTAESTNNTAWGGGVLFGSGGQILERYCIGNLIRFNKALASTGTYIDGGVGGGLVISGSPRAEIRLNDIRYNEVEGNVSSGIKSWGAGVLIQNQTSETMFAQNYVAFNKVLNNSQCNGAGISIWNPNINGGPQIINNIITNNTDGTYGGGVFAGGFVSNSATFINNTIYNNSATQGGAIYVGYSSFYPSHPNIINSILWNPGDEIFLTTNSTVAIRYCDVEGGYTGLGNINSNPSFSDTLFHLADWSPCIGTGIDSIEISGVWYYAPLICYFGGLRPNPPGSNPDIGACESSLSDPIPAVEDLLDIPKKYSLNQNYPNPFNPTTNIGFRIADREFVSLKVFDILGNEVANLVNEELPAGDYKIEFDGTSRDLSLTSGIYFYQLKAGDFISTKKMILMK